MIQTLKVDAILMYVYKLGFQPLTCGAGPAAHTKESVSASQGGSFHRIIGSFRKAEGERRASLESRLQFVAQGTSASCSKAVGTAGASLFFVYREKQDKAEITPLRSTPKPYCKGLFVIE